MTTLFTTDSEPEPLSEKELAAYLAGIIDADGYIGVRRSTHSMRKRGDSQPTFFERIAVKQVEPQAVQLLHARFGGSLMWQKSQLTTGRPLLVWQATHLGAAACLRALLPYLRIKRAQAENALALRAVLTLSARTKGPRRRAPHLTARMEELYQRAKILNAVGAEGGDE